MLWHFDVIMHFFIFLVDFGQFSVLFDSCFPILRKEWGMLESVGISSKQVQWVYYLPMKHSTTSVCVCLKLNSMIAVKQKNSGWRLHKNLRTCVWHQHQRPECGDSCLLVLEATRSINCNSTWGCIFGWWLLIYIYIYIYLIGFVPLWMLQLWSTICYRIGRGSGNACFRIYFFSLLPTPRTFSRSIWNTLL